MYDNLTIQGSSDTELQAVFENSKLVKITSAHATEEPDDGTLTLAGGTDGVIGFDRLYKRYQQRRHKPIR